MNRTSAAALAVAAVIGITGGTYAASLGLGPADDGQESGEQQTPTTDPSTPTRSEEP